MSREKLELRKIISTHVQAQPDGRYVARMKFERTDRGLYEVRRQAPSHVLIGSKNSWQARAEVWAYGEADAILEANRARETAIQTPALFAVPVVTGPIWGEVMRDYVSGRNKHREYSGRYLKIQARMYRLHLAKDWAQRPVAEFTYDDLEAVHDAMMTAGRPKSYWRTMQTAIRCAFRFARVPLLPELDRPLRDRNKILGINQALTPEQYEQLLAMSTKGQRVNHALIILLGGEAGLRSGEIAGLRRTDVDYQKRTMTICRQIIDGREEPTKSLKPRIVGISDRLLAELKSQPVSPSSPYVLGRMCSGDTASKVMQKKINRLKKLNPELSVRAGSHCLRHYMATQMLLAGAEIHEISQVLGHASIETTQIYLHSDDYESAKAQVNAINRQRIRPGNAEVIQLAAYRTK